MDKCMRKNSKYFYETASIQVLDPLRLDASINFIREANACADTRYLAQLLTKLSNSLTELNIVSNAVALAAMRDIGILLGSLKRHGVEPVVIVPQVEPLLIHLGQCSGMIPRDTVLHYTSWNPDGDRRRAYTNDPQERLLQVAVVKVFPSLSASLCISEWLRDMDPRDVRCAPLVNSLHDMTATMVESIDCVVRDVSPIFFAQTLRPYFEDINVGGRAYLGPAAAQVPLWLVDLCVWASDRSNDGYNKFLADSVPYCPPSWQSYYEDTRSTESLVSRVVKCLEGSRTLQDHSVIRTADSITRLLRTLITFRGRHLGIARKGYAPEVRQYENGSGGAPVALLKEIIELTIKNENLLLGRHPKITSSPPNETAISL